MKALSIQQPWAWLIVNGYKDLENRDWPTHVRGEIKIHAGKKFDDAGYAWVSRKFPEIPLPQPSAFERGGIVGHVTISACVAHSDSPWFQGTWGFVFTHPYPEPFQPCRGMLGFFEPNASPTPTGAGADAE